MEKEKNNRGVIILLTVIIVILAVLCILFATGAITLNTKTSENTTKETSNSQPNTTENKEQTSENNVNEIDFNQFLNNITNSLSWLVVLHSSPEFGERKNIDYLSTIEDKQMFVMEYILSNQENYKNFVVISVPGGEITSDSPTNQATLAYYPYSLFNQEYKKFFDKDFDASKRIKAAGSDNKYNENEQYVYYANRRPGRNGQYVSNMTVEDTKYDENTKTYTALVNMTYSDKLAQQIGVNSEKAEITYSINNSNIILKTFIIK